MNKSPTPFWADGLGQQVTYRWQHNWTFGITVILVAGVLPIAWGLRGIAMDGLPSGWAYVFFVLIGLALGLNGGISILAQRVIVNDLGIKKSTMFRTHFSIKWDTIEFWSIELIDDLQIVKFQVPGRRWLWVTENDVSHPGLASFLRHIRLYAPAKEHAMGQKLIY